MADEALRELETAAQVIMAPPNIVTAEQRQAAESVFLTFRRTSSPYQLCRHILDTSKVDYVLFESVGVIKTSIIRDWYSLKKEDIDSLRQYLLHYMIEHPALTGFVREKILQVVAIIIKRGSVDEEQEDLTEKILTDVEQLFMNGTYSQQILCCGLMLSLLQEFGITNKSADVGLTWEVHGRAKRLFQAEGLKQIFQFTLKALNEVLKSEPPFADSTVVILKNLLTIAEGVLTWVYIPSTTHFKPFIRMHETWTELDDAPALKLPASWADVAVNGETVNFFFQVYWKVRDNPGLARPASVCLVQLASLSGPAMVIRGDNVVTLYMKAYIQCFLNLVSSVELLDREAPSVAKMLSNLFIFFHTDLSTVLPCDLLQSFLDHLARLTCKFAEKATYEITDDEVVYKQAFESLLKVWIKLLSSENPQAEEYLKNFSRQIFDMYIKCHLSPPVGSRPVARGGTANEIEEFEADDRDVYQEQLQCMGVFGRYILGHSVPLLSQLLEERTTQFYLQLQRFSQQPMSIGDSSSMDSLMEDIHWLILIAGHVIITDSDGEDSLLPPEIIKFSLSHDETVNVDISLKLLTSPNLQINDIPGAVQSADPIVRLIAAILRLCEIEKKAAEAKLNLLLSPEVGRSLMWCLQHISLAYLINNSSKMFSGRLKNILDNTEGMNWAVNFLLGKIESNLRHFNSEPALIEDTVRLLVGMAGYVYRSSVLLESPGFTSIMSLHESLPLGYLSQKAKRGLYKAFSLAICSEQDSDVNCYLLKLVMPLQEKFKSIVCQENFSRNFHEEKNRIAIIDNLDSVIGVIQGSIFSSAKSLFNLLLPVLSEYSKLIGVYQNYQFVVDLILELHAEYLEHLLVFLKEEDNKKLTDVCLQSLQIYSRCCSNRINLEAAAEEDSFRSILILLKMLQILSTPLTTSFQPTEDVVIFGLSMLMPLMTADLLNYPELSLQYFKTLSQICETYSRPLSASNSELLQRILASVEFGLASLGEEISLFCLKLVASFAENLYQEISAKTVNQQVYDLFRNVVNLMLNQIFNHHINTNHEAYAARTLFALICCYPVDFRMAKESLINNQPDENVRARLTKAFTSLVEHIEFNMQNHRNRIKFRENFEKFLVDIQGFLFIK